MVSVIASVVVSAALVLAGMWAHIDTFNELSQTVKRLKGEEQRFGVATVVRSPQGGTGTSTAPVPGDILMSFANNVYGPTALEAGANITLSTSTYRKLTISAASASGAPFAWSLSDPNGQAGVSTSTLLRFLGGASSTAFSANTLAIGQTATATISSAGALTLPTALAEASGGTGDTDLDDILGTANQITVSDGANTIIAGNATLSLPSHVIFPGNFQATNATTTNATSTSLNVTGAYVDFDQFTSALLLTGTGGIVAEYAGTSCTNQFVRSLDALGAATCATVGAGDVSLANLTATDTTLTFSGTYNGSTARTIGVNLGANFAWTGAHDFGGATSIEMVNGTGPDVGAAGRIALDTTANEFLIATSSSADPIVIKPFDRKGFAHASSTHGSGTTTRPFFIAPVLGAGYVDSIMCHSNSFLRVLLKDEAGNRMNDLVASSTEGVVKLTTNNSFTASEVLLVDIGTTTAPSSNVYLSCWVNLVYTRN